MTRNVLVIDDETNMRWVLGKALEQAGYTVHTAGGGDEGLTVLGRAPVELVLLDLKLRGEDGLTVLRRLRERRPDLVVMILTAHGTVPNAVEAMQLGAADFLRKPFDVEEIVFKVARALERRTMQHDLARLSARQRHDLAFESLIGAAPVWQQTVAQARLIAQNDQHVLLAGETGSGRATLGRALHVASARGLAPLIEVDAHTYTTPSAIVGEQADSVWNQAIGGSLLLRGVDDFPTLQEQLVARLTIPGPTPRLLIITGADGLIVQPLLAHIASRLLVPPLRERPADVLLFAHRWSGGRTLSPQAVRCLEHYPWPGNITELRGVIQRSLVFAHTDIIGAEHLPQSVVTRDEESQFQLPSGGLNLEAVEQHLIRQALEHAHGNKSRAAELLGLTRHTLLYRLEKYGITSTEKN